MTDDVKSVTRTTLLREVRDLLYEGNLRHVPVCTEADFVRYVSERASL